MIEPKVTVSIDGRAVRVEAGTTVAVALLDARVARFRAAISGEPRGPLCGMGICFECRVTIDGRAHQRSCLIACEEGMAIATDGGADA